MGCAGSSEKAPEVEEKSEAPSITKKGGEATRRKSSDAPELTHRYSAPKGANEDDEEKKVVQDVTIATNPTNECEEKVVEVDKELGTSRPATLNTEFPMAKEQVDSIPVSEVAESCNSLTLKSSWLIVELDEKMFSLLSEDMLEKFNEYEVECASVAYLLVADCNSSYLCQTIGVGVLLNEKMDAFNEVLKRCGARLKGYGATHLFFERWRTIFFSVFPRYIRSGETSFTPSLSQEWDLLWKKMTTALYEGTSSPEGQVFGSLYHDRNARRVVIDVDLIRSRESRCDPGHRFSSRLVDNANQLFAGLSDEAPIDLHSAQHLFEVFCFMVSLLGCKAELKAFFQKVRSADRERLPSQSYLVALFQPFIDTSHHFLPDVWNPAVEYYMGTYYYQMINFLVDGKGDKEWGESEFFPFPKAEDVRRTPKSIEGFSFLDRKRTSSVDVHNSGIREIELSEAHLCGQSTDSSTSKLPAGEEVVGAPVLANHFQPKQMSLFEFGERASWAVVDFRQCSCERKFENKGKPHCSPEKDSFSTLPRELEPQPVMEKESKEKLPDFCTEKNLQNGLCGQTSALDGVCKENMDEPPLITPKNEDLEATEGHAVLPDRDLPCSSFVPADFDGEGELEKASNPSLYSSSMVVFVNESVMGEEEQTISSNNKLPLFVVAEPKLDYGCVLCTNIADSLSMWRDNSEMMYRVQKSCNRLIRSVISRFDAHEIKREGDSFIIASQNVVNGLKVALGIQLELMRAVPITPGFRYHPDQRVCHDSTRVHRVEGDDKICWNDQAPRVRISLQMCAEEKADNPAIQKIGKKKHQRHQHYASSMQYCALLETMACGGQILMSIDTVKSIFNATEFSLSPCDAFLRSVEETAPCSTDKGKSLKDFVSFVDLGVRHVPGTKKSSLHLISVVPKCLAKRRFNNYFATC